MATGNKISFTPKILLLGTGYVLTEVAKKLAPDDFIATTRNPQKLAQFEQSGFFSRKFDRSDPESLISLVREFPSLEVLVDSLPPSANDGEMPKYFGAVGAAASAAGLKKFIYLSTTGVYGVTDGSWVFEDSPINPLYSQSQLRAESENFYSSNFNQVTILRIPAIHGPGREGIRNSLIKGTFRIVESAEKWTNRVEVSLLSRIILDSIDGKLNYPIINCCSGDPALLSTEVNNICRELNLEYPQIISRESAIQQGMYTRLLNQRVGSKYLAEYAGEN